MDLEKTTAIRILTEKSIEYNLPLCFEFVAFETIKHYIILESLPVKGLYVNMLSQPSSFMTPQDS